MSTIADVLYAVSEGDVDLGLVPIENAIEGTVNVTMDMLAFETDLFIQRELVVGVHMNLMAPKGVALSDITRVLSIPVATAQCRRFLHEELRGVPTAASNSTAQAAEIVAQESDGHTAALAPARAAEVYGLEILAHNVEDHPDNQTRFIVVSKAGIPQVTGHDKTSIVVFQRADAPGSLLAILQEFAARSINLSKLESRPTKQSLGDYCFIIDLVGHLADQVVADALRMVHMKQALVKYLGSYPAAASDHGDSRKDAATQALLDANQWLRTLRSHMEH